MGNNNRMQVKQNTNTLQRGAAISTMDNLKKHAVLHLCDHDSSYTDEADSLSVCRCPPGESGWLQQQVLERAAASSPHTAHGPRLIHSPGKIQVRDYWRAEEGALAGRLQAPETRVFWACSPSMEHTSLGQVPREMPCRSPSSGGSLGGKGGCRQPSPRCPELLRNTEQMAPRAVVPCGPVPELCSNSVHLGHDRRTCHPQHCSGSPIRQGSTKPQEDFFRPFRGVKNV